MQTDQNTTPLADLRRLQQDLAKQVLSDKEWQTLTAAIDLIGKQAAEIEQLREERDEALKLASKYASEKGNAEGQLLAIGWQGGVEATIDRFREENERLRAELAARKGGDCH